ncbi:MAG: hypothetical protein JSU73_10820 [candidate division WOR-3 bacterium]|nr:MAG: hypothetical protein JSU73_10820 [candidate division WOR-3 bacterium]
MLKLTVLALACLVATPLALAEIPRFAEPELIQDGGVPIDVGNYAAPMMFDWNEDGRKDMIVGQFSSGYIRFYPNVGEDSAPVFSGFEYMRASGSQITLPYG